MLSSLQNQQSFFQYTTKTHGDNTIPIDDSSITIHDVGKGRSCLSCRLHCQCVELIEPQLLFLLWRFNLFPFYTQNLVFTSNFLCLKYSSRISLFIVHAWVLSCSLKAVLTERVEITLRCLFTWLHIHIFQWLTCTSMFSVS